MVLYMAIKVDAGGEPEPLGTPTTCREKAEAQANQSLSGEVTRLVTDDFFDQGLELLLEDKIRGYHDKDEHRDLVPVRRDIADAGLALAKSEIAHLEAKPEEYPDADPQFWNEVRQEFRSAVNCR